MRRTQSFFLLALVAGLTPGLLVLTPTALDYFEAPSWLDLPVVMMTIFPLYVAIHYTTNIPSFESRLSDGRGRLGYSGMFIAIASGILIGGQIALRTY